MVETWKSITTNGVYICRTSLERNAALATTRQRVARRVERRPGSHLQQYSLAPMTVEHGYRYIGATARNEITGQPLSRSLSNRLNRPYASLQVAARCDCRRWPFNSLLVRSPDGDRDGFKQGSSNLFVRVAANIFMGDRYSFLRRNFSRNRLDPVLQTGETVVSRSIFNPFRVIYIRIAVVRFEVRVT